MDNLIKYRKIVVPVRDDSGWSLDDVKFVPASELEEAGEPQGDVLTFWHWCWLLKAIAPRFVEMLSEQVEELTTPQKSARLAVLQAIGYGYSMTVSAYQHGQVRLEDAIMDMMQRANRREIDAECAVEEIMRMMR